MASRHSHIFVVAKRAQLERDGASDLQSRRLRGGDLSRRPAPCSALPRVGAAAVNRRGGIRRRRLAALVHFGHKAPSNAPAAAQPPPSPSQSPWSAWRYTTPRTV